MEESINAVIMIRKEFDDIKTILLPNLVFLNNSPN